MSQLGHTAFYLAAQRGHEDVVELLLKAKADPALKTKVIDYEQWIHYWELGGFFLGAEKR